MVGEGGFARPSPEPAKVRVKDPFAGGIEEFERAFRFGPSRPSLKPQTRMKIERVKMQTTLTQSKRFTSSPSQFAFQAPTSRQVSLAADFNNWDTKAAPMQKGPDGIWRLSVPLGPGRYEYRFYADGVWQDDPTAQQRAANALGTENCVRIVAA